MNQILKKITPVIVGVCALNASAVMTGDDQHFLWKDGVTDGYYNDPANWVKPDGTPANAAPDGSHFGFIHYGAKPETTGVPYTLPDITIRFPAGGLTEESCTYIISPFDKWGNRTITFDARGTFWEKPQDITYEDGYIFKFIQNKGNDDYKNSIANDHVFAAYRHPTYKSLGFKLDDGLLRFESIAGEIPTYNIRLEAGTWDLGTGNKICDSYTADVYHNIYLASGTSLKSKELNLQTPKATKIFIAGGNHTINTMRLKSSNFGLNEHDSAIIAYGESSTEIDTLYVCAKSTNPDATVTLVASNNASVAVNYNVYVAGDPASQHAGLTGKVYISDDAKFTSKGNMFMVTTQKKDGKGANNVDKVTTALVELSDRGKLSAKKITMADTPGGVATITVNDDATFEFGEITGEPDPSDLITTSVTVNNANLVVDPDVENATVTGIDAFELTGDVKLAMNANATFNQNISGTGNLILNGGALATFAGACTQAKTVVSVGGKIKFAEGASVSGNVEMLGDNVITIGENAQVTIPRLQVAQDGAKLIFEPGAKLIVNEFSGPADKLEICLTGNFTDGEHELISFPNGLPQGISGIGSYTLQSGKACSLQFDGGVVKAVVASVASGSFEWTGNGGDGKWETIANWNCNGAAATRIPSFSDDVTIPVSDSDVDIVCDGAIVSVRKITATGTGELKKVTISGDGRLMILDENALSVNGAAMSVAMQVLFIDGGVHLAIPEGSAIELNGPLSCNAGKLTVNKDGLGKLTIAGDNRNLAVDWIIPGGYNTFRGPNSFGADTDSQNGLVLSNNTLRYEGAPASIKRGISFESRSRHIHIKTDGDLRFREYKTFSQWPRIAAYVKTGVGTLTFEVDKNSAFFTGSIPNSAPTTGDQGIFTEPENGMLETNDGIYGGMTILEGTFHVKGKGKNAESVLLAPGNVLVGGSGYVAAKSPELFLEDVDATSLLGSWRHFAVGRKFADNSAQPKITLVNAVMRADDYSDFKFASDEFKISNQPVCPTLVMTNSFIGAFENLQVNGGTSYIYMAEGSEIMYADYSATARSAASLSNMRIFLDGSYCLQDSGVTPFTFRGETKVSGNATIDFLASEGAQYKGGDRINIANFTSNSVNNVSSWTGVNAGDHRKVIFSANERGDVVAEIVSSAGMVLIIR